MVKTKTAPTPVLIAREEIAPGTRCDRCRMAPAKTRLTFVIGSTLYLCAHHFATHELALETDPTVTIHTEPNECPCHQCVGPQKES